MKKVFIWVFLLFAITGVGILTFFVVDNHNYPLKYEDVIRAEAEKNELSPQIIAAMINTESGFDKDAISSSGAIGLMQLMPTTAKDMAQRIGYQDFELEDLFVPDKNIEIGCYYLKYLLEYFDGDTTNALAAYNAGLSNVKKWLKSTEYSQDGMTLHSTPYKETNDYIKKIYKNIRKYKSKI